DVESKAEIRTRGEYHASIEYMLFSPNGDGLATMGGYRHLCLWDSAQGSVRFRKLGDDSYYRADFGFSPDGQFLDGSSEELSSKLSLVFRNCRDGKIMHRWSANKRSTVRSTRNQPIAYSPDGGAIAVVTQANTVDFWDTNQAKIVREVALPKEQTQDAWA